MNSIVEKVQETIKAEEIKHSEDINYKELKQFIEKLKELGLYKKPEYTLPPVDTIGYGYSM